MQDSAASIWVTKNSGDRVQFSRKKLQRSLTKSGASEKDVERILFEIEKMLYPNISTKEIYKKAFRLLRKTDRPFAAKYKLKKALLELGPTGFPFERYLAEVLKHDGYQVEVGKIMDGHCISHEVDVVGIKGQEHIFVECKFHAESRRICDVKIPLYVQSRFMDLKKQLEQNPKATDLTYQGWVATNTRFSSDAMQYGICAGLHLLGWNFPKKGSLKERIDASGVHPITCLTTLTGKEKKMLLDLMIVLCKDVQNNVNVLLSIGIKEVRAKRIMEEAKQLCNLSNRKK